MIITNPKILLLLMVLFSGFTDTKKENIDHLILAINDLNKGIAQFKELTGVEPTFGGVHPKSFTQNALVALDNETYVEIMAPRSDAQNVPEDFKKIEKLTFIGWAVRTRDIERTREKLKAAGFGSSENQPGSRAKPDGSLLKWTTFRIEGHNEFPFFIQWDDSSIHPSASSPTGCTFKSLKVTTPDTKSFVQLNNKLGIAVETIEGKNLNYELTINTPKGQVTFSSMQ